MADATFRAATTWRLPAGARIASVHFLDETRVAVVDRIGGGVWLLSDRGEARFQRFESDVPLGLGVDSMTGEWLLAFGKPLRIARSQRLDGRSTVRVVPMPGRAVSAQRHAHAWYIGTVRERSYHVVRISDRTEAVPEEVARVTTDACGPQPPAGFVVLGDTVVVTHARLPLRVELFLRGRRIASVTPAIGVAADVNSTVVLPVAATNALYVATVANVRDDSRRIISFCRVGQVRRDTTVLVPFAITAGRRAGSLSAVLASEPMEVIEYDVARAFQQ